MEGQDQGRRPGSCAFSGMTSFSPTLRPLRGPELISLNSSAQPPTIQHALDSWTSSSNVGTLGDRRDFVKTHMSNIDNGSLPLPLSPSTLASSRIVPCSRRDPPPSHSRRPPRTFSLRRLVLFQLPSTRHGRSSRRDALCSLPRSADTGLVGGVGYVPAQCRDGSEGGNPDRGD